MYGPITSFFEVTQFDNIITDIHNEVKKSKYRVYLVLDSKNRLNISDPTPSELIFDIATTRYIGRGAANVSVPISNITSIRLYQIRFPYQDSIKTETKRVSIFIKELSSQSQVSLTTRTGLDVLNSTTYQPQIIRYHWINKPTELYPIYSEMTELEITEDNESYKEFNPPITELPRATFIFNTPYQSTTPIKLKRDYDLCTFTYGNPTIINLTNPHEFTNTSYTYIEISGFNTNTPYQDQDIINTINNLAITSPEHYATITSPTQLSISVDTSSITSPIIGLTCTIYYNERRIIIPLELECSA